MQAGVGEAVRQALHKRKAAQQAHQLAHTTQGPPAQATAIARPPDRSPDVRPDHLPPQPPASLSVALVQQTSGLPRGPSSESKLGQQEATETVAASEVLECDTTGRQTCTGSSGQPHPEAGAFPFPAGTDLATASITAKGPLHVLKTPSPTTPVLASTDLVGLIPSQTASTTEPGRTSVQRDAAGGLSRWHAEDGVSQSRPEARPQLWQVV